MTVLLLMVGFQIGAASAGGWWLWRLHREVSQLDKAFTVLREIYRAVARQQDDDRRQADGRLQELDVRVASQQLKLDELMPRSTLLERLVRRWVDEECRTAQLCPASGWRVHPTPAADTGEMVCPVCSCEVAVGVVDDIATQRRISEHNAPGAGLYATGAQGEMTDNSSSRQSMPAPVVTNDAVLLKAALGSALRTVTEAPDDRATLRAALTCALGAVGRGSYEAFLDPGIFDIADRLAHALNIAVLSVRLEAPPAEHEQEAPR